jgi:dihydrofolate reductase
VKTILYMAQSLNGQIAYGNDCVNCFSQPAWNTYARVVKNAVMIVGRKTYTVMPKEGDFDRISPQSVIVVSKRKNLPLAEASHYRAASPKAALAQARRLGAAKIVVSGGAKLNTAFLKAKLVDEMILNIEPILIGNGVAFLTSSKFNDLRFKLLEVKKLKQSLLELRYAYR